MRVSILRALCGGPLSVGEVVKRSDLSQPAISHHLRILREAGIVTAEKRGTTVYYALNKERLNSMCCCVRKEFGVE